MAGNPKLTVLFEKLRGKTFEIDKEQMSIGRRDTNDICIKEPSLSGHHADIFRRDEDGKAVYVLRDNDSTNGTRVNNVPLTGERVLKNSDLILFGGVEVLFDSNDDSDNSGVLQTHTIDISSLDSSYSTVVGMTNMNPFAAQEVKRHKMVQKIMIAVLAVVGLGLVGLIGWLLIRVISL